MNARTTQPAFALAVTDMMARQFVALHYEGDITKWLQSRFPAMKSFVVVQIEQDSHHVLVSETEAKFIKQYLLEDLEPPFCRRIVRGTKTSHLTFEPGLDFHFDQGQPSSQTVKRTAAAYRSLGQQLTDTRDRIYVQSKLAELDAKISRKR